MTDAGSTWDQSDRARRVASTVFWIFVAIGLAVRLWDLGGKPLHHDEGVNGSFLLTLVDRGAYRYQPDNYHGPFLYLTGWLPLLVDRGVWGLRMLPALAGAGSVALLWAWRRRLGAVGLPLAAGLVALSPTAVYVSRTAIHESYFTLFTLLAAIGIERFHDAASDRPRSAARWLIAAATALALTYANKETAVLTYGAFGVAGAFALGGRDVRARLRATATRCVAPPLPLALSAGSTDADAEPLGLARGIGGLGWAAAAGLGFTLAVAPEAGGVRAPVAALGSLATVAATVLLARSRQSAALRAWSVPALFVFGLLGVVGLARLALTGAAAGPAWALARGLAPSLVDSPALAQLLALSLGVGAIAAAWSHRRLAARWFEDRAAATPLRSGWALALGAAALVLVVCFTSAFSNPRGLLDLGLSLPIWIRRGLAHEHTGHEKPLGYYVHLLVECELPLVALVAIGGALTMAGSAGWRRGLALPALAAATALGWAASEARAGNVEHLSAALALGWIASVTWLAFVRDAPTRALAGWAASIAFVYSALSYKTPWLVVNLTLPLALLAGRLWDQLASRVGRARDPRTASVSPLAWAAAIPLLLPFAPSPQGPPAAEPTPRLGPWASYLKRVVYDEPDDERHLPAYGQSTRDLRALTAAIVDAAGPDGQVRVTSADYWPLPFLLRAQLGERVGYPSLPDLQVTDGLAVVIGRSDQEPRLRSLLPGWPLERFALRSFATLTVFRRPGRAGAAAEGSTAGRREGPGETPGRAWFELRRGLQPDGPLVARTASGTATLTAVGPDLARALRAPFRARWRGVLHVERDALTTIAVESVGARTRVWLDDDLWVGGQDPDGALGWAREQRWLTRGAHRVTVDLAALRVDARLSVEVAQGDDRLAPLELLPPGGAGRSPDGADAE